MKNRIDSFSILLLSYLSVCNQIIYSTEAFGFVLKSSIYIHDQHQNQNRNSQKQKVPRYSKQQSSCSRSINQHDARTTQLYNQFDGYSEYAKRKDIKLPLLVIAKKNDDEISDEERKEDLIIPLPSAHLPMELSTLNLYGVSLKSPSQKRLIEEAIKTMQRGEKQQFFDGIGLYGHVAAQKRDVESKDDETGLVGTIGCAVEVLISQDLQQQQQQQSDPIEQTETVVETNEDNAPVNVLTRGSFRFIVKSVVSIFPFPVVIVDELLDDEDNSIAQTQNYEFYQTSTTDDQTEMDDEDEEYDYDDDDDEDDDDYDIYEHLSPAEITSRTLQAMDAYVQMKLAEPPKTLLEQSILKDAGVPVSVIKSTEATNEEMAAVFQIFKQELVDIATTPAERRYAIAFIAAEIASINNEQRAKALITTDSVQRLKDILNVLESKISMERAKKMANEISDWGGSSDGTSGSADLGGGQELKVGKPPLPKWADSIKKGMMLEYFWNEEWGWCECEVEDVFKILDEVIVTVRFLSDGEAHKLPITGEDKVRWRPAQR